MALSAPLLARKRVIKVKIETTKGTKQYRRVLFDPWNNAVATTIRGVTRQLIRITRQTVYGNAATAEVPRDTEAIRTSSTEDNGGICSDPCILHC